MSVEEHRAAAPQNLRFAVVTVSDTRTLLDDRSGQLLVDGLSSAGYELVDRRIVPDEPELLRAAVIELVALPNLDAIVTTGGTGITARDRTPEALETLINVPLPGFGELFRALSYQEIGAAAMLSRAFAGRIGSTLLFCLPGSTAAVRLALDKLLVGELKHLVHHARG